jgi:hypothetical protein
VLCNYCRQRRSGILQRVDRATLQGVEVQEPLVYSCEGCQRIVATPQATAGRIFAASESTRSGAPAIELRVPKEAEDLALAIYAALGVRPSGDVFALPIALGLRHAGMCPDVDERWRLLDALDKTVRARPVLSEELLTRIDSLEKTWCAPDRSSVARWLVVAGASSLGLI